MPVADFMMKKEYWKEAADLYNEINLMSGGEAGNKVDFLRKEGYVLQKSKAYDEALKVYQKANIIEPDTPWIEKRLATCYRMTGAYEEALEMYLKIDEKDGGSASNTYYTGICQMELNRYDEALNTFFRLDFDESNSVRAWRGIAWCSFLADKLEQAMRYYNKVIEAKPGIDDYMNAGHVAWCMGDIKQAVSLYRKVAAMVDNKDQLSIMFEEDCFYLVMKGIDDDDIALMTDLL
jgi:tetratricopeptide (TPR) repeat protein